MNLGQQGDSILSKFSLNIKEPIISNLFAKSQEQYKRKLVNAFANIHIFLSLTGLIFNITQTLNVKSIVLCCIALVTSTIVKFICKIKNLQSIILIPNIKKINKHKHYQIFDRFNQYLIQYITQKKIIIRSVSIQCYLYQLLILRIILQIYTQLQDKTQIYSKYQQIEYLYLDQSKYKTILIIFIQIIACLLVYICRYMQSWYNKAALLLFFMLGYTFKFFDYKHYNYLGYSICMELSVIVFQYLDESHRKRQFVMNYYQLNNLTMQQEVIDSLIPSSMIIFSPPQDQLNHIKQQNIISPTNSNSSTNEKMKFKRNTYTWEDVTINHYNKKTQELFNFNEISELKQKLNQVISIQNQDSPINNIQKKELEHFSQSNRKTLIQDIQQKLDDIDFSMYAEQKDQKLTNNQNEEKRQIEFNIQTIKESNTYFCINDQFYQAKYAVCNWKGQQSILILLINDSIERRNQQLEQMNSYKDKLLATVSHDLKTPLNSIISITDYLYNDIVQTSNTTISSEENHSPNISTFNHITHNSTQEDQPINQINLKLKNQANLYKKSFRNCKNDDNEKILSQQHQKYLKIIYNNSLLLLSMINDILDYSQLNYAALKKLKLNITKFELQELVQEVYDIFQFQATAKNIQLLCTNNKSKGQVHIFSDRNRIKQILINFISNSMKFTIEGHVKVHFTLFQDGSNKIGIQVEDTGVGMPQSIQQKLFSEFGTFNQCNLNSNGIGLGLVICKKFIDILGSSDEIKIKSEEGKGSSFYFEINTDLRQINENEKQNKLPGEMCASSYINNIVLTNFDSLKTNQKIENVDFLIESQDQLNNIKTSIFSQQINNLNDVQNLIKGEDKKKLIQYKETTSLEEIDQKIFVNFSSTKASIFLRESHSQLKKSSSKEIPLKKILNFMIVDDSQFNLLSLKIHLKEYSNDIQVDEFLDGVKAFEAIKTKHYDVILTDVQMPIMNGIQLVQEIRNLKESIKQPKIMLVTAGHEDLYEKEIKNLDIYSFINKPIIDKKQFKNLINQILKQNNEKQNQQQI